MMMMMIFVWMKVVICARYKVLFRTDQAMHRDRPRDRQTKRQTDVLTNLKILKYFETNTVQHILCEEPSLFVF